MPKVPTICKEGVLEKLEDTRKKKENKRRWPLWIRIVRGHPSQMVGISLRGGLSGAIGYQQVATKTGWMRRNQYPSTENMGIKQPCHEQKQSFVFVKRKVTPGQKSIV